MYLSIIVPTHNRPDHIGRLIDSLINANPVKYSWEVIIILNAYPEYLLQNILSIIKNYDNILQIKCINEPNKGKTKALNFGIKESVGDIISFLDDDVEVHIDYLVGIEKTINNFPYNVFGGRVVPTGVSDFPYWVNGGKPITSSRGYIVAHDYGDHPRPYGDGMVLPIGCNFFCRRNLFEKFGLFDVRLGPGSGRGMAGDETNLLLRFRNGGETIYYSPLVTVDHPIDPERMTKASFRWRMFWAGRAVPYLNPIILPSMFGIPRYLFRMVMEATWKSFAAVITGDKFKSFDHQLEVIEYLGAMYEFRRIRKEKPSL